MFRILMLIGGLVGASMAQAQSQPVAGQNGPDLEFVCNSDSGATRSCVPAHPHYKRYMHLANWRFVGAASAPGTCALGHTYGYGRNAVWVAGDCVGIFRAPDLRYGDTYNRQRLAGAYDTTTIIVEPGQPRW